MNRPAAQLPDLAQFAADELGDEFLEELVHVEQEREGFGAAGTGLRAGAGPEHLGQFQQRTIEVALVGAATMAEHPLAGLVEIVRLRGDIGHVGKHGTQLRQVPAGVGPLRPGGGDGRWL